MFILATLGFILRVSKNALLIMVWGKATLGFSPRVLKTLCFSLFLAGFILATLGFILATLGLQKATLETTINKTFFDTGFILATPGFILATLGLQKSTQKIGPRP